MAAIGEGDHASADSCRMGQVKSENGGAGVCWQT